MTRDYNNTMADFIDDIKFWFIVRWYWWKHRHDSKEQRIIDREARVKAFHESVEDFKNGDYPNDKTYFETVACLEEAKKVLGDPK